MACEEKKDKGDMEEEEEHDLGLMGRMWIVKGGDNDMSLSMYCDVCEEL